VQGRVVLAERGGEHVGGQSKARRQRRWALGLLQGLQLLIIRGHQLPLLFCLCQQQLVLLEHGLHSFGDVIVCGVHDGLLVESQQRGLNGRRPFQGFVLPCNSQAATGCQLFLSDLHRVLGWGRLHRKANR
jgi:hypothetical protein